MKSGSHIKLFSRGFSRNDNPNDNPNEYNWNNVKVGGIIFA
jgi:hypothetical protein